jgi:hypothetical protein
MHGRRKIGATIGLRGRAFTSCPALCHAVIRARRQISKQRGPSTAKCGVKTKPPQAVTSGQSDHLRATDQYGQAGTEEWLASPEQRNCNETKTPNPQRSRCRSQSMDCALSIGVVRGARPLSRASARVSRAVWANPYPTTTRRVSTTGPPPEAPLDALDHQIADVAAVGAVCRRHS